MFFLDLEVVNALFFVKSLSGDKRDSLALCGETAVARLQVFGADPVGSTNGHDVAKRGGGWYDGIARKERDDTYIEALTSHCSGTISRDRKDWNAGFRVCASIGTMRLATSA